MKPKFLIAKLTLLFMFLVVSVMPVTADAASKKKEFTKAMLNALRDRA